jgi:serine phosphatase RsbU (regulator of sigma subunit)
MTTLIPEKPSLLIVDDEPANLQKLRRTFHEEFRVFEARSGDEALGLLRGQPFSAIITDQRMPGIRGVDLLRESLQWSPHAVRIILTGYTDVDDLMGAINDGQVHRYITKPWEPFSLRRTVLQDIEHRRLKLENRALTEQLRIAADVQSQLFPQIHPEVPNLEYLGLCRLARSVGGDYYDFLQFHPEKLWIAVGDISGKGVSAALLMANLQGFLRSNAPLHGEAVEKLVASLNRHLCQTTDGSRFTSLFYGVFEGPSRRLDYVNGGHCAPLVVRGGDGRVLELGTTGTLVGLFPEAEYERESIQMEEGDTLLIYTDGVTEAEDGDLREFGEERLREALLKNIDRPLQTIAESILAEVARFTANSPQQDDQAIVLGRIS